MTQTTEHIRASELKVGDYFKYRFHASLEHYVQSIRNGRIYEVDSELNTSSIPDNIYVERIINKP